MGEGKAPSTIRLYHTTTSDKADSIMANGFRDHGTVNKRLTVKYLYEPGVWLGDVPALDDELFDGVGLFGFDAEKQAFIAITIPAIYRWPCEGVQSFAADATWPGTQYWAKAAVWNQFPRTRMSLDDIVGLRLASADPAFVNMVRKYATRDYSVVFAARVRRALDELRQGRPAGFVR